jgi:hypothetical protein
LVNAANDKIIGKLAVDNGDAMVRKTITVDPARPGQTALNALSGNGRGQLTPPPFLTQRTTRSNGFYHGDPSNNGILLFGKFNKGNSYTL